MPDVLNINESARIVKYGGTNVLQFQCACGRANDGSTMWKTLSTDQVVLNHFAEYVKRNCHGEASRLCDRIEELIEERKKSPMTYQVDYVGEGIWSVCNATGSIADVYDKDTAKVIAYTLNKLREEDREASH